MQIVYIKRTRNEQKNQFSVDDYEISKFHIFLRKIEGYMKSIYYCKIENKFIAWHEKLIKLLPKLYNYYINTYGCKSQKQMEQQNPSWNDIKFQYIHIIKNIIYLKTSECEDHALQPNAFTK